MKLSRTNIAFLFLCTLIVACSPNRKFTVLSFFFDGVPEPTATSEIISGDSLSSQSLYSDSAVIAMVPSIYNHYPYQEKECMFCHDENAVGEMTYPEPDLCYACHEDYTYKYENLHGPVDAGYCTQCHDPHSSKNEKLTRLPGNELCFYCHVSFEEKTPDFHIELGDEKCTECHNPHGEGELTALHRLN